MGVFNPTKKQGEEGGGEQREVLSFLNGKKLQAL